MTFEEANEAYDRPESSDDKYNEAVLAFGIELHRGICFKCSRLGRCLMCFGRIREVAKCNFFTEAPDESICLHNLCNRT